mmetsp:Transcript_16852/g.48820  ORF Transcript_16852/g.48820 Transcript_16852/m.48820 type:complete len:215 (-) Transcript_16852:370-1014(-)
MGAREAEDTRRRLESVRSDSTTVATWCGSMGAAMSRAQRDRSVLGMARDRGRSSAIHSSSDMPLSALMTTSWRTSGFCARSTSERTLAREGSPIPRARAKKAASRYSGPWVSASVVASSSEETRPIAAPMAWRRSQPSGAARTKSATTRLRPSGERTASGWRIRRRSCSSRRLRCSSMTRPRSDSARRARSSISRTRVAATACNMEPRVLVKNL